MIKAFVDVMLEETIGKENNMNRLVNKGVYLVCWIKRFQALLLGNWKPSDIACFIHMGGCKNEYETIFLKYLSYLPVDVRILVPNLNDTCILSDKCLYEQNHTESLNYRNSRRKLQTMFEEIKILWKEEVKYRPGFETMDGVVRIPVIFSKISGVKNGDINAYWDGIRELMREDVFLVKDVPYIAAGTPNRMKVYVTDFFKNGRVQKEKVKKHKNYLYQHGRKNDLPEEYISFIILLYSVFVSVTILKIQISCKSPWNTVK
ncbi:MAG: YceG family protein [Roseburia sp.]|nr:YceG family protein [Roseburia sp.]